MISSYCDISLDGIIIKEAKEYVEEALSNFKTSYDENGSLTVETYWMKAVPAVRIELSALDWDTAFIHGEAFQAFENLLYDIEIWAEDNR